jgi:hypothetical protein
MSVRQNWRTESYKGMDVHVTALRHAANSTRWDFTVRVAQPGEDTSSNSELSASAGDDTDYATEREAVEAGLKKGYAMVDSLLR